jgi:LysM repeat protein
LKHQKIVLGATAFAAAFLFATSVSASSYTKGVDVANYQDSTQEYFAGLKNLGATFSIVKLGGSGGGEGTHYQNPKASAQLANSAQSGLNVAGYFWGQFGADQASAKHMAGLAVSDAQKFGLKQGSTIALDYEAGASSNKEANTAAIKAFMQAIKEAGYKPALYSGAYYMKTNVNIDEIGKDFGTCLWVASYKTLNSQTEPDFNYFPSMKYVAMWQYGDCWYNLSIDADTDLVGFISKGGVKINTPVKPTQAKNSNTTTKTYTVKSGDSWWKIANTVGLDMYQLAELNGKTISSVIHPGDILKINGTLKNNVSKSAAKNTKSAKTSATSAKTYTVRSGDSWWAIAKKYGISMYTLASLNGKSIYNTIYPGQKLKVSGSATSTSKTYYKVKSGDTVSKIAGKYGTTAAKIKNLNSLKNVNLIYVNENLRIK